MQGQARRWYGPRGCVCRLHCCKFAFHAESLLNVCTRGPLAALLGSSARFLLVHRPPRAAAARTPRAAAACTAPCMNMLKGAKELAGAHPTTPSRPATGRVHCTEEFPHADLIATCCIHPCVHRTQVVDAARQRIHIGAHGKRVVAHTPLALFVLTQALAALSQEPQETDRFYDEQLRTDGTRLLAIGGLFHTPQPSVSPNCMSCHRLRVAPQVGISMRWRTTTSSISPCRRAGVARRLRDVRTAAPAAPSCSLGRVLMLALSQCPNDAAGSAAWAVLAPHAPRGG